MKLSTNLKREIKLHLFWLVGTIPGFALIFVPFFNLPICDGPPLWIKIALPALCIVANYLGWRNGLSPDKKTFKPRIWK